MRNVVMEIRALNNVILRDFQQKARAFTGDAVSGINSLMVGYILRNADRDVYQRELEDEFGITRSTVSKIVNLMEKKGLIDRVPAEHDARQRTIRLTDNARKLGQAVFDESENMSKRLLTGFSEEEIAKLEEFIIRMKRNIGQD